MLNFSYDNPVTIHFGRDALEKLPIEIKNNDIIEKNSLLGVKSNYPQCRYMKKFSELL